MKDFERIIKHYLIVLLADQQITSDVFAELDLAFADLANYINGLEERLSAAESTLEMAENVAIWSSSR